MSPPVLLAPMSGWATWRRAWTEHGRELGEWPALRQGGCLEELGVGLCRFARHLTTISHRLHSAEIDAWNAPWLFDRCLWGQHTVLPEVDLVEKIALGHFPTNTKGAGRHPASERLLATFRQLAVEVDESADRWTMEEVFDVRLLPPWLTRALCRWARPFPPTAGRQR